MLLKLKAMVFIATIAAVCAQEESPSLAAGESMLQKIEHFPQTANEYMKVYTNEKLHQYTAATAFVRKQFGYWKKASDCEAFTNTFEDKFEYCDAQPGPCIVNDREWMTLFCKLGGKIVSGVYNLKVQPYQEQMVSGRGIGMFDSSRVVVTGKQEAQAGDFKLACFDLAIRQELVFTTTSEDEDDGDGNQHFTVKSKLWHGYYTMEPGPCVEGIKNPFKKLFWWYIKSQFRKELEKI